MKMSTFAQAVFSLGGGAVNDTESFPSPTLFVIVYAVMWIGLVGWIAWLATRQHGLDRGVSEVQSRLQSRLDRAEHRPSAD